MANFDTAAKRFSGLGLGDVGPALLPIPDGTIGAGDRLQLLDLYSGLAAAEGGGSGGGTVDADCSAFTPIRSRRSVDSPCYAPFTRAPGAG